MDKILDKALNMIGALADKLGQTAETLMPAIVQFMVWRQIGETLAFGLAFVLMLTVALHAKNQLGKSRATKRSVESFSDEEVVYTVIAVVGGAASLIVMILTLATLPTTIAALNSPMGFAAMQLIGK